MINMIQKLKMIKHYCAARESCKNCIYIDKKICLLEEAVKNCLAGRPGDWNISRLERMMNGRK